MNFAAYKTELTIIAAIVIATTVLYNRTTEIEANVTHRIDETINRLLPMINKPDTAKKVVTPQLQGKQNLYYFFEGKTTGTSKKMNDIFKYDPDYPNEIWDGYITPIEGDNGGRYYLWSESKLQTKSELSMWIIADKSQLEYGYHKNDKDKEFVQMVFPIVQRKKYSSQL